MPSAPFFDFGFDSTLGSFFVNTDRLFDHAFAYFLKRSTKPSAGFQTWSCRFLGMPGRAVLANASETLCAGCGA
jgi:hypothetical protein